MIIFKQIKSLLKMELFAKKLNYILKDLQSFRQLNMVKKEKKNGDKNLNFKLPNENFIYGKPAQ